MTLWLTARSPWRRAVLAVLAGAASALALPPFHLVPLLLLTVPTLLALLGARTTALGAAATGLWFGFGLHLVGLYWITDAILYEADAFWWLVPLAVPGLSVVLATFIAVPCVVAWWAPAGWRRAAVLSGGWVLADLARQFVATGFPWNPLGSAWAIPGPVGDVFIQPASLMGMHGLTLLTLLLATTPAIGRRAMGAGLAVLILWAGFGVWRLHGPAGPPPGVTLVLVQGDIAQGQKWDRAFMLAIFRRYLDLTRAGVARARHDAPGQAIVVIWPETASPFFLETDANARAAIAEAAGGALVLAGSVRFDAADRPRNSLIALDSAGPPLAIYDKWHLVPFGEYQPSWVPFDIFPGGGFASGPGPRTLVLPGVPPAGALICYEAIFPAEVVDPAHRPAWLVNVTNDAWFGNSTGPRQHLAAARMRAVEEGLPLARAANTGISAVFDGHGHELDRLGLLRAGTLVAALPPALPPTPASRLGLWPALALSALVGAAGLIRRPNGFFSKKVKYY
jgi:apolipoprotein N-acyltransferase